MSTFFCICFIIIIDLIHLIQNTNASRDSLSALDSVAASLLAAKVAEEDATVLETDVLVMHLSKMVPESLSGSQIESGAGNSSGSFQIPPSLDLTAELGEDTTAVGTEVGDMED